MDDFRAIDGVSDGQQEGRKQTRHVFEKLAICGL